MSHSKLESHVGESAGHRKRTMIYSAVILIVVGLGFVSVGVGLLRSGAQIFADTNDIASPPTPADPVGAMTPVTPSDPVGNPANPPTPGLSGQIDATKWAFPSGWSMVPGSFIEGGAMESFKTAGLILYSFNDPAYPNRLWSTFPWGDTTSSNAKDIVGYAPFGYYVYNPANSSKTVDFGPRTPVVREGIIIARGWHLVYWPNETATKDNLFSKIQIKYQDGTTLSAKDAATSKYHRTSIKVYSIANENVIDASSAIKELADTNTDTTISSIPPRSFFWLYLRRTKDRVVDLTISQ